MKETPTFVRPTRELEGAARPVAGLRPGDSQLLFGTYELKERLGSGGMAQVHRAIRHGRSQLRMPCALKRLLEVYAAEKYYRAAFAREARLTARLQHPNLRTAHDFGEVEGACFLELELVEGPDLRRFLQLAQHYYGPPPVLASLFLLDQLLSALDYLHRLPLDDGSEGIIHRDISPGNVLIAHTGQVKLIDLGVAISVPDAQRAPSGQRTGKLGYLSPEAFCGGPVDVRADLYAVGIIAHELLTARRLFREQGSWSVSRPSEHNPEVSPLLDAWVMCALAPEPADRWSSAKAMRDALIAVREDVQATMPLFAPARWVSVLIADPTGLASREAADVPSRQQFHEQPTLRLPRAQP